MMDLNVEQETLRELSSRKQNLLLELKNYEANQTASLGTGGLGKASMMADTDVGMIPAQTQLQTALAINLGSEGKAVSETDISVTLCVSSLYYMFLFTTFTFYLDILTVSSTNCIFIDVPFVTLYSFLFINI